MVCAIILAGGLGTRLAGVLPHLPKALAPIQQTPFLKILLQQLERAGILSKIILALGHKADNIQHFLKDQPCRVPIDFSIETSPLGTGGALLHALHKTSAKTLFVLNGDSYFDFHPSDFLAFHQTKGADISIACTYVKDSSRYGAVEIENFSHRITAFNEKTLTCQPGWVSAGIYLMERAILSQFSEGVYSLEKDFLPHLLKKTIFAYPHKGNFIDIGTPSSYNDAQELLKPWILS